MAKQMADRRKIAVVLLVAAVVVAVGGISSYAAKYAHKETAEKNGVSEEFYFTSDLLTGDGSKSYDLPVGTTSVTFELRNYADDLRFTTESPIAYSCTVTKDDGSSAGTLTNGSGSIATGDKKAQTVTVNGLSDGTYTVTATSSSPYAQTLSAKFTVAKADGELHASVNDSDGSPSILLTISAQDFAGTASINWPAGLIPDTTQDDFANTQTANGTGSSVTYEAGRVSRNVEKFSSYSFRFFKTDTSKTYSYAVSGNTVSIKQN